EAWSVGSHTLDWKLGTLNTGVLLLSSFTAAQAVRYAQLGERGKVQLNLIITFLCAAGFMVIKAMEYNHKFHVGFFPGSHFAPTTEGLEELGKAISASHYGTGGIPYHIRSFFGLYFVMTGLHGLHVLIGMGLIVWMLVRNARGEFTKDFWTPIDIFALYWHLVDLIWIFLFPLIYLID
ncbi:MAG: cytochrome c oxidase subunit 3, partial [Polyangiaceae bacterium]|nr:cytochrome c oxidase subunit 3 [Polyangiaceae bacterium]